MLRICVGVSSSRGTILLPVARSRRRELKATTRGIRYPVRTMTGNVFQLAHLQAFRLFIIEGLIRCGIVITSSKVMSIVNVGARMLDCLWNQTSHFLRNSYEESFLPRFRVWWHRYPISPFVLTFGRESGQTARAVCLSVTVILWLFSTVESLSYESHRFCYRPTTGLLEGVNSCP